MESPDLETEQTTVKYTINVEDLFKRLQRAWNTGIITKDYNELGIQLQELELIELENKDEIKALPTISVDTRDIKECVPRLPKEGNIFEQLKQTLTNDTIPWISVLSFESDNCSVMMGKNNSMMTRIKEKSPDVFDFGCVSHLVNLCAVAGVKALLVSVDDILVDIYYHFHHSSKRKEQYKEFLDFCDIEPSYSNTQLQDGSVWKPVLTALFITGQLSPVISTPTVSLVSQFYCAVLKNMVTKFPFNDQVVSCLALLNPAERGNLDFNDTLKIVKRFPVLVPSTQFASFEEEFIDYQVTPADERPKFDTDTKVDSYWAAVLAMTNKITRTARFPLLTRVTRAMCCIPNSIADCEKVFSMVKKIHTEHKSSLNNSTLCDLLTTKINSDRACYQLKPDQYLLKTEKKACVAYNKDYGN
ncbi:unnamed protein product [Mytilus coruscus]|uniref:HAT C-terminal dimerisation domain-containing protein n=1 Tax=Mytilus coruscus TaxID=42192 RepID=A0A6J8B4G4_MYTCO|nr:unnamed protein product [Mytilus coruscus]